MYRGVDVNDLNLTAIKKGLSAVSADTVLRAALVQASEVLNEVTTAGSLSLGLRERAAASSRVLVAIQQGTIDRLQSELMDELRNERFASAAVSTTWAENSGDTRPAGLDGMLHAATPEGATLCGLPANALEILRSRFVANRLNSCPECSQLSRSRA